MFAISPEDDVDCHQNDADDRGPDVRMLVPGDRPVIRQRCQAHDQVVTPSIDPCRSPAMTGSLASKPIRWTRLPEAPAPGPACPGMPPLSSAPQPTNSPAHPTATRARQVSQDISYLLRQMRLIEMPHHPKRGLIP